MTEQAAAENFSLPLWPGIPAEAQERVIDVVRSAVRADYCVENNGAGDICCLRSGRNLGEHSVEEFLCLRFGIDVISWGNW